MKTELKDYLLSTISISLILFVTFGIVSLIKPYIPKVFVELSLLILILLFLLLYGFITAIYLKIINRFFSLKGGAYDMSHVQFTIWKHFSVVGELGKWSLKIFFPIFLRPIFYKIFGADIGKNIAVAGIIIDPTLTKIHDYAVLGQDSVISSHLITSNNLFLNPVVIGKKTVIGINAVIMPGVIIGENSIVAPGAVVLMDTKIPPNEFWGGVPAKKIKDIEPSFK
jgi:acetyltransferase-like isoleucine patch superfamily enzyme